MKDRKMIFAAFFVVLAVVIATVELRSRTLGPPPVIELETAADERFVSAGINKDGIPSIDAPVFVGISEADVYLSDDGRGLSVTLGGVTRFYPYQILVWHEVVNDTIADIPIAVTYCALCDSGMVYQRSVHGSVLTFGVSGQVWNANTILYDRETDSRWSQLLGKALDGNYDGTQLIPFPAQVMTWADWKSKYPFGQVLSKETGVVRDYTRNPYFGYEEERRVLFPLDARDDRLHPKEAVYGYIGPEGQTSAYPLQYLVEEGEIVDEVEGRKLTIRYGASGISATGENAAGEEIEVVLRPTYWYVWYAFFPETQLYDPIGDAKRAEEIEPAEEFELQNGV